MKPFSDGGDDNKSSFFIEKLGETLYITKRCDFMSELARNFPPFRI